MTKVLNILTTQDGSKKNTLIKVVRQNWLVQNDNLAKWNKTQKEVLLTKFSSQIDCDFL
jgi:hypothetical protein